MQRQFPRLLLATAFVLMFGCQPNEDAPSDSAQEQPASAQEQPAQEQPTGGTGGGQGSGAGGGHGGGGGQGGGTGGGQSGECGGEIVLTLDGEPIWRRTREELVDDPAVGPIAGYRDGDVLGVRVEELLAGLESIQSVRIRSCGGRSFEVKAQQLSFAPLYLQQGGSGRWRLVDFANPDAPTVFIRDVAHIEASTEETTGDNNPDD